MSMVWIIVLGLFSIFLLGIGGVVYTAFSSRSKRLREKADEKLREGSTQEAVSILTRLAQMNPFQMDVRWKLAEIFRSTGQYERALEQYEYCLQNRSFPEDVSMDQALVQVAELHEEHGEWERALETWNRLLDGQDDFEEARFRRGITLYQLDQFGRAAADFESLLEHPDETDEKQTEEIRTRSWLFLARCQHARGHPEQALEAYERYLETTNDDLDALLEAASVAEEMECFDRARAFYERTRRVGNRGRYEEATLRLLELAMHQSEQEQIKKYMDELEMLQESGDLSTSSELQYKYLKARHLMRKGQKQEAEDLFWSIYRQDSDFGDINSVIDDMIETMDQDELLDRYLNVPRGEFVNLAERIVRTMGYDVLTSDSFGPDEVNVVARKDSPLRTMDRMLFAFKRWKNTVGEWPLKEFELQLVEKRYDRGFFICPAGFNEQARAFARDRTITLMGPDTLLSHIREAQRKKL